MMHANRLIAVLGLASGLLLSGCGSGGSNQNVQRIGKGVEILRCAV